MWFDDLSYVLHVSRRDAEYVMHAPSHTQSSCAESRATVLPSVTSRPAALEGDPLAGLWSNDSRPRKSSVRALSVPPSLATLSQDGFPFYGQLGPGGIEMKVSNTRPKSQETWVRIERARPRKRSACLRYTDLLQVNHRLYILHLLQTLPACHDKYSRGLHLLQSGTIHP